MPNFKMEKEIVIDAPVDVVWRTITEPDQITRWFADRVEMELKPGGHGFMGFGDQGGPIVVETVDPPNRFAYRWNHPAGEEVSPDNSVLVEFTLVAEGKDRTRLKVTESGLERLSWPDTQKEQYAEEHRGGWADFMDRLAGLFAER